MFKICSTLTHKYFSTSDQKSFHQNSSLLKLGRREKALKRIFKNFYLKAFLNFKEHFNKMKQNEVTFYYNLQPMESDTYMIKEDL